MRAELFFEGETEELTLPENTVFVSCGVEGQNGCTMLNEEGLALCRTVLGFSVERIPTRRYPVALSIHALVDPSGELAQSIRENYPGLETARLEWRGLRFTVTV